MKRLTLDNLKQKVAANDSNKTTQKKYNVFSPDGFTINFGEVYNGMEAAKLALKQFCSRYERQGYYSTVINGERVQIPFNSIQVYCKIMSIKEPLPFNP